MAGGRPGRRRCGRKLRATVATLQGVLVGRFSRRGSRAGGRRQRATMHGVLFVDFARASREGADPRPTSCRPPVRSEAACHRRHVEASWSAGFPPRQPGRSKAPPCDGVWGFVRGLCADVSPGRGPATDKLPAAGAVGSCVPPSPRCKASWSAGFPPRRPGRSKAPPCDGVWGFVHAFCAGVSPGRGPATDKLPAAGAVGSCVPPSPRCKASWSAGFPAAAAGPVEGATVRRYMGFCSCIMRGRLAGARTRDRQAAGRRYGRKLRATVATLQGVLAGRFSRRGGRAGGRRHRATVHGVLFVHYARTSRRGADPRPATRRPPARSEAACHRRHVARRLGRQVFPPRQPDQWKAPPCDGAGVLFVHFARTSRRGADPQPARRRPPVRSEAACHRRHVARRLGRQVFPPRRPGRWKAPPCDHRDKCPVASSAWGFGGPFAQPGPTRRCARIHRVDSEIRVPCPLRESPVAAGGATGAGIATMASGAMVIWAMYDSGTLKVSHYALHQNAFRG